MTSISRAVFALLLLICGAAQAQIGTTMAGLPFPAQPALPIAPGDILAAAGTPAVALYSCNRNMLAAYTGPLCKFFRGTDSTTIYSYATPATGLVNMGPVQTYCGGVTYPNCRISAICDQIGTTCTPGSDNTLPAPTPAASSYVTALWQAGKFLPFVQTISGTPFRNRANTINIPTGSSAITLYGVAGSAWTIPSTCCGGMGNMENPPAGAPMGGMFALSYSYDTLGPNPTIPNFGVDFEGGLLFAGAQPIPPFGFTQIAKHAAGSVVVPMIIGDATTGTLTTYPTHNPYRPNSPSAFALQGGLSIGEGGDLSAAPYIMFEFAVIPYATASGTDDLYQANVAAWYGGTSGTSYTGVGDLLTVWEPTVTSWYAYWSTRAFSAATRGDPLMNACNSTGGVDVACSDILSDKDTGLLVPKVIGGITCPSVAAGTNCTVKTWYNQVVANSGDVTQATIADRLTLTANCVNTTLACVTGSGASSQLLDGYWRVGFSIDSPVAPYSMMCLGERTGGFTSQQDCIEAQDADSGAFAGWTPSANTMYATSLLSSPTTIAATDSSWHSMQALIASSSAGFYFDGAFTSASFGTNSGSGHLGIGGDRYVGNHNLHGNIIEAGIMLGAVGTTMNSAVYANQKSYCNCVP